MNSLRLTGLLAAMLAFTAGLPAAAQSLPRETLAHGLRLAAAGVSLDQAVEMAERRFRARVVRADVREEDGRTVYVLRLLNDSGRVWTVRVDAASGRLM